MNLCGEMNTASLRHGSPSLPISMSTYGAAAAKSQNDSAPYACSSDATRRVSVTMPVTFDAAENEPMSSGRCWCVRSALSSASTSMWPSASSGICTTSAIDSRHGSSLEWCSNGPMNTAGRSSSGMCAVRSYRSSSWQGTRRPRMRTILSIAPVEPEPQNSTAQESSPPTASRMIRRASSRSRVVCRPVPLDSVCVLAYRGSTSSRMKSSRKVRARPEAV